MSNIDRLEIYLIPEAYELLKEEMIYILRGKTLTELNKNIVYEIKFHKNLNSLTQETKIKATYAMLKFFKGLKSDDANNPLSVLQDFKSFNPSYIIKSKFEPILDYFILRLECILKLC